MTFDLENWHPSCEQAKHLAGSFRIAGIAFFAGVAGPGVHAILSSNHAGLLTHLSVLICICDWIGFEAMGYAIIGKGGAQCNGMK